MMYRFAFCLATTLLCLLPAAARSEVARVSPVPVSAEFLRFDLLELSAALLAPAGFYLDEGRAQITTSDSLTPGEEYTAVARWQPGTSEPRMPLIFDLVPSSGGTRPAIRATVAGTVLREVLVMDRRAERGAAMTCASLVTQRKPLRLIPPQAMQPPCTLGENVVLRRTLLAGEPVRQADLGVPTEVSARGNVSVRVVVGPIVLEKTGMALDDACLGEKVRVRLNGGAEQLNGRVVARNVVLVEGSEE